jgi:hypothetical protein
MSCRVPRHLELVAGEEPVVNHHRVGRVRAQGEALLAQLVKELGGALPYAKLGAGKAAVRRYIGSRLL